MPLSFKYYNHLGFNNPFYSKAKDEIILHDSFEDALSKSLRAESVIDEVTVVQYTCRHNILGDRTIVRDVKKSPWMAKLTPNRKDWDFFEVPSHAEDRLVPDNIVAEFSKRLKTELLTYINEHDTIGILLTGGMDSRIIAALLYDALLEHGMGSKQVVALTWGFEDSRDVVYSREISKRLNWDWKHYPLEVEDLLTNIEESAKRGSEYSPIHLHSMLRVRDETGLDCIIAGSFGDSIGRGEYAGRHVSDLRDLRSTLSNKNRFVRDKVFNDAQHLIEKDIESYWRIFPQTKEYQQFEQDFQIHYMRRKLNPCLAVIDEKIPLYQAYTSPEVFGFIWSLDPSLRGNFLYKEILKNCTEDLSDIPWSRTGLVFDEVSGTPDKYLKDYHSYSKMIRYDLFDTIKDRALSESISKLGIFNMAALESYFKFMRTPSYSPNISNEEKLIWIASLSRSIEIFKIRSARPENFQDDRLSWIYPIQENVKDRLKEIIVKLKK